MARPHRETFFATCAPGIEPVLHQEAKDLKFAKIERQVGGVRFEGTLRDAWKANLCFRAAVRVLLRVARFEAEDGDALYRGVRGVDWGRFLTPQSTFVVSAQSRESKLDHSLFVEQRTKDSIADQFREKGGDRPSVDKTSPDVVVHVHLSRDRCTVSIDTSGASLHKRGWRRFQGRAPLSEALAAAIVLMSGWDRRSPLIDPFCGSGTILIEAALIALGIPAGSFRERFAFERLPGFDERAFRALREELMPKSPPNRKLILRGVDLDSTAIAGARENIESAGLTGSVEVERADVLDYEFKRGWNGWIVANPPYGERVGVTAELKSLYREFGVALREKCGGYRVAILSGNSELSRALDITPRRITELYNGAIPCELLELEIPR